MKAEVLWISNGGRLVVELPDHGALIRCQRATDTWDLVSIQQRESELSDMASKVWVYPYHRNQ